MILRSKTTTHLYLKKSQGLESSENIAKKYALKLLSYRSRSVKEIKERLMKEGFSDQVVSSVINYLQKTKLINDMLLAEELKRKLIGTKLLSQHSVRQFMHKRGIPEEIIDSVLNYGEAEDSENARKLIQKKMVYLKNHPVKKIKKKLHDLLLRKGYSYEIINMALKEINLKED